MTSSLHHSGAVILQRGYPAVRLQAMMSESGHHRAAYRLGLLYFSPREDRRARAGDRTTQGAGGHCPALYVLEARDQGMPLRFDDHIVERVADHVEVVRVAPADEAGEIGGLPDEVRTADVGFQDGSSLAGAQEHMGMHQYAAQRWWSGNLLHARVIDADRQHQSAEQAGRDVVDVRGAAGDDFPFHGELQKLQT